MMTDDNDRTQEIRRDGERYSPTGQGDSAGGSARDGSRKEDTAVFHRPGPGAGQPVAGEVPRQQTGGYPPAGAGYQPARPAPARPVPAQSYGGAPMLPADRGSGGFPAAIVGAVVATLVAVATAFGAYQILKNHSSIDPQELPGYVVNRMGVLPWPSGGGGSDLTTGFVVGVLIVLVVTVLLMMAAAMSTRAGTGGFALFLAAWMASVLAGGVARPIAGLIVRHDSYQSGIWQADINAGVVWGVLFGWIAALVLVIVHAMRRKPVQR